jgi:dTDP-4-amino-4,6-dideoxygalactose transaminase
MPIIRPTLPPWAEVEADLRAVWESGLLTTASQVAALEREVADRVGVPHVVALGNCTAGLVLMWIAAGIEGPGEVIVPSFTFAATAHGIAWNGLTPVFVECHEETFNVDVAAVRAAITERTKAILAVHVFGLPADVDELEALSEEHGIPLLFDAAQALGASYRGRAAGSFGLCEVFSMSPTKVITAGEGGLLTTHDGELAARMRFLRDYGKGPDGQDMHWIGLNGRMSEFHAAVGRAALRHADAYIARRLALIAAYRERLAGLPGIGFQEMGADRAASGNYMVLRIDAQRCPISRDALYARLAELGIQAKKYFWPPVHQHTAYARRFPPGSLPRTERASGGGLALPLYGHMTDAQMERVVDAVRSALRG